MDNQRKSSKSTESYRIEYLCRIFKTDSFLPLIGKEFTVISYPCCGQRCKAIIYSDGFIILDDGSTVEPEWLFKQYRVEL